MDYRTRKRHQKLARERNAVMRAALVADPGAQFVDLGHFAVAVVHPEPDPVFIPMRHWPAGLTCLGCGGKVMLDARHRCRECARGAWIGEAP
jgi:hypothetical protein